MNRENFSLNENIEDILFKMSEGNLGALNVLMQIMATSDQFFSHLLLLDDMNIRGTQIWLGYKDFSGSDVEVFMKNIETQNADMIICINEEGRNGNHEWKAVKSGALHSREML